MSAREFEKTIDDDMIKARRSHLLFYVDVPLYIKVDKRYVLYKPSGTSLREKLAENKLPMELYINKEDKLKGLIEAQKGFTEELKCAVKSKDPERTKKILVTLMEETLYEPRAGILGHIQETMSVVVDEFVKDPNIMRNLITLSQKDYSTSLHCINMIAFTLCYGKQVGFSIKDQKELALCAMLHDVGKTEIPDEILHAPRKLTDEEFEIIKSHTTIGYQILMDSDLRKYKAVPLAAFEHHERLDGSGYPENKRMIHDISQILAIIDPYEALTNDDRPYRSAMAPFAALKLIRKEVDDGKYRMEVFENFILSLSLS